MELLRGFGFTSSRVLGGGSRTRVEHSFTISSSRASRSRRRLSGRRSAANDAQALALLSGGISLHTRPSSSRPPVVGRGPPHCLWKNAHLPHGTSRVALAPMSPPHAFGRHRPSGASTRALAALPPDFAARNDHAMRLRSRSRRDPSSGSALMNLTAVSTARRRVGSPGVSSRFDRDAQPHVGGEHDTGHTTPFRRSARFVRNLKDVLRRETRYDR